MQNHVSIVIVHLNHDVIDRVNPKLMQAMMDGFMESVKTKKEGPFQAFEPEQVIVVKSKEASMDISLN